MSISVLYAILNSYSSQTRFHFGSADSKPSLHALYLTDSAVYRCYSSDENSFLFVVVFVLARFNLI